MRVSGSTERETDMECRNGSMVQGMKDNGALVKLMDRVSCIMQTEIFMRATGSMIRLMVRERILMRTELSTLENGKMTKSMGMEKNFLITGQNNQVMKVFTATQCFPLKD